MKTAITFLLVISLHSVYGQQPKDPINTQKINYALLTSLFLKQFDQLRVSMKREKLSYDVTLEKAAKDQAEYMLAKKEVTHSQNIKGKEKPSKRVLFYKGTNGSIGENCLFTIIGSPIKTNYRKDTIVIRTYEEAATDMLLSWKNSKGHYTNMISASYEASGIGFAFDPQTKRLYVAQVFGTKSYDLPKELIIAGNAYGVEESDKKTCVFPPDQDWATWKLSNYLSIRNDSIFQYYADLEMMQKVLSAPGDGIAVDIVKRDQFTCNTHQLHGSPVYDGMMLAPVYSENLFKSNKYKKYNELYSYLGKLPSFFDSDNYQLNTILIKSKHQCRYSFPVDIVSKNLRLLDLVPVFETTYGLAKPDSFDVMIEHRIPFERSITTLEDSEITRLAKKLNTYKDFIKNISIQTFSSIEGSTENNVKLQEARAKNIRSQIGLYVNSKVDWQVESKENWEAFYRQIRNTPFSHLKNYDQTSLKEKLKDKAFLDTLDILLDKQREAIVKIYVKGTYSDLLAAPITLVGLKRAIQQDDSLQAWVIQSQMIGYWKKNMIDIGEMGNYQVPLKRKFLPVISNILGTKAYNLSQLLDTGSVNFAHQALQLDTGRFVLKYNYCVYALKRWSWIGDTIENTLSLEKKILSLLTQTTDKPTVNKLLLNYYVLDAYHCYTHHRYDRMTYCLRQIRMIYPSSDITEDEALRLAKLFNKYMKIPWSMDLMLPFAKKENASEEMLFTFLRSGALYREGISDEEYFSILDRGIKINKERFCKWIDKIDFQLLREAEFKTRFCALCQGQ